MDLVYVSVYVPLPPISHILYAYSTRFSDQNMVTHFIFSNTSLPKTSMANLVGCLDQTPIFEYYVAR